MPNMELLTENNIYLDMDRHPVEGRSVSRTHSSQPVVAQPLCYLRRCVSLLYGKAEIIKSMELHDLGGCRRGNDYFLVLLRGPPPNFTESLSQNNLAIYGRSRSTHFVWDQSISELTTCGYLCSQVFCQWQTFAKRFGYVPAQNDRICECEVDRSGKARSNLGGKFS